MQHDVSIKAHFLCVSCRHHHRGPIMIVTEAAGGLQRMQHDVPSLADFPCCEVPSRVADSKYPPLQWQQRAAKVAVHRIAAAGFWLQVLLNAASSGPNPSSICSNTSQTQHLHHPSCHRNSHLRQHLNHQSQHLHHQSQHLLTLSLHKHEQPTISCLRN